MNVRREAPHLGVRWEAQRHTALDCGAAAGDYAETN